MLVYVKSYTIKRPSVFLKHPIILCFFKKLIIWSFQGVTDSTAKAGASTAKQTIARIVRKVLLCDYYFIRFITSLADYSFKFMSRGRRLCIVSYLGCW
jgi:hypothetical protein